MIVHFYKESLKRMSILKKKNLKDYLKIFYLIIQKLSIVNLIKIPIEFIRMIGKLSLIILVHCIYSLLRYRKYLLASQQPLENLPIDIIVEILFGVGLGIVSILSYTDSLKNLRQFVPIKTYDASFTPKNLGNYNSSRTELFLEILKEKHSTQEFLLN